MISDAELIKGCQSNDRLYQKQLYERFARKMLTVCLCYARDRYEAENVLQEGFIKIFENLKNYKPTGSFEGWIRRIIVNTATDYYRKMKRIKYIEVDVDEAESKVSTMDIDKFATEDIVNAIQKLPEGGRMVFTLFAIEGYSHAEIAEQLGISVGTSKSQYARARTLLQTTLKNNERNFFLKHNIL
ncbi:MAG TPA: sigma-70 family RNA polymerase sigma factor [Bacteroidia bacterium]|nr:sigma-70 family RNA polymerase sigma factor [Bacteroidia bacterium]